MRVIDIPQIEKLSIPEKILLVEDMWDSISSEESAVPVPESHMTELDRRLLQGTSPLPENFYLWMSFRP